MIGQQNVLNQIDNLIEKGFPRFVIITGQKGQGKTEIAKYIYNKLENKYMIKGYSNCQMIQIGIKIDEIRNMIDMAYKQTEPVIYLIQNADKMSIGAKNSLLKVIEEPPNNAYIIMELQQIQNTLETIKSRCQEIKLENYDEEDIQEMILKLHNNVSSEDTRLISKIAQNNYQITKLLEYGVKDFYNYVAKVFDNIYKVQSANSFKISEKLNLKDDEEGYDLEIFWNMYIFRCIGELFELMLAPANEDDWAQADIVDNCITITEKYKQKLNINGINKQSLFDMWILDIRKAYRERE
jgi:replication-associated recombination protein RarA